MANVLEELIASLAGGRIKIIDLTQRLSAQTPVITLKPPAPRPEIHVVAKYGENSSSYSNNLHLWEHTGTHFDAPIHWVTGKDLPNNACDTIAPEQFVGPACVINVAEQSAKDADFLLTPDHIRDWEGRHGRIPARSWLLLRTDWSKRSGAAFLNEDANGAHSPGFHKSASELLARERDVLGVGVETVGTDAGQAFRFDPPFPNHATMHGAGKFGLASLCNLDRLPPTGAMVVAAPLKIIEGSGSPVRVLAFTPA